MLSGSRGPRQHSPSGSLRQLGRIAPLLLDQTSLIVACGGAVFIKIVFDTGRDREEE
jgi:hypothetical protein